MAERGSVGTTYRSKLWPRCLAEIGIPKAKLEIVEPATWVKRANASDFDLYDLEWVPIFDPMKSLLSEFKSDGALETLAVGVNTDFDDLLRTGSG